MPLRGTHLFASFMAAGKEASFELGMCMPSRCSQLVMRGHRVS